MTGRLRAAAGAGWRPAAGVAAVRSAVVARRRIAGRGKMAGFGRPARAVRLVGRGDSTPAATVHSVWGTRVEVTGAFSEEPVSRCRICHQLWRLSAGPLAWTVRAS